VTSASLSAPRPGSAFWTPRREAVLVASVLAVVYLATMTGSHHEAEDSLAYAAGIRDGHAIDVLNQNHLAWGALGWLFYNGLRGIGLASSVLAPLQVMDALLGALGAGILWSFVRRVGFDRLAAGATCGVLCLSYGYWYYSGEAEVYILSAVVLIVCLVAAHSAATRPSPRAFALLGLANGVAVLAHDTNVLFATVAAAALLTAAPAIGRRALARCAAAYAAVAGAVVVAAYAAAAIALGFSSFSQFYDWLTKYTSNGEWGHLALLDVPKAGAGLVRALVGADFLFAFDPGSTIRSVAQGDAGAQLYLMRDFPDWLAAALTALALVLAGTLIVALVSRLRRRTWAGSAIDRLALAWLVPYTLFFAWWEPVNIEFWIAWWIPAAVLAGPRLAGLLHRGGWRRLVPAAVLGGLLVVNLVGSILPQQSARDDLQRVRTDWYTRHAKRTDLILTNGYVPTNYALYFTRAHVLDAEVPLAGHPRDLGLGIFEIQTTMVNSGATRFLADDQTLFPQAGPYADCFGTEVCRWGRTMRPWFLPGSRVVGRAALDRYRVLARPQPGKKPG
jgi:hypothetical protein